MCIRVSFVCVQAFLGTMKSRMSRVETIATAARTLGDASAAVSPASGVRVGDVSAISVACGRLVTARVDVRHDDFAGCLDVTFALLNGDTPSLPSAWG